MSGKSWSTVVKENAVSLSRADEDALCALIQAGRREDATPAEQAAGLEARDRLVTVNLSMGVAVARRYRTFRVPFEELVAAANEGLVAAANSFDSSRGNFCAYALLICKHHVLACIGENRRTMRLPYHVTAALTTLVRAQIELVNSGQEPTVDALTVATGFTPEKVVELLALDEEAVELNAPAGGDEFGGEVGDFLASDGDMVDEVVGAADIPDAVNALFDSLPPVEALVMRHRLGFETSSGTVSARSMIATETGLTVDEVARVEALAVARFKHPVRTHLRARLTG